MVSSHRILCAIAFTASAAVLAAAQASANVGEAYGFGSRSAALGGASVSWGQEGFAAYTNPAALAATGDQRLVLSWGVMDMEPKFTPISGVVKENNYVSDKTTPISGDINNEDYKGTFGQELGFGYRLVPSFYNLSVGMTTFLPVNQVAYMDTGEPFAPEYFLYRARTQRPQIEIGTGAELANGFFVGAGIHVAFSLTSSANVFIQTSANKPSTMRFRGSMKPKAAPVLALMYASDRPEHGPTGEQSLIARPGSYSIGLVTRFPVKSAIDMQLNSGARALGDTVALDFNFSAASALFYDPLSIELGGSWQYLQRARAYAQLDYQFWSKFESPALTIVDPSITNCSASNCGAKINPSYNPGFPYRDILVPRFGHEYAFDTWVIRTGYAYKPSILKTVSNGTGNYLDPPKHMINAGVGFKFKKFLGFDTPCNLDVHGSYHQLVTQKIIKSTSSEIGAPGYDAGGKIFGGGVSLTLAF